MENKFAENDFIQIWNEAEILFWEFKPETILNSLATNEILELFNSFCQKDQFFVIQDMTNLKWIDKKSRDLFATNTTINNMKAWAYYSELPIHKIVYSIYITFSKPTVPTNFFVQKENGINWLYKVKSEC